MKKNIYSNIKDKDALESFFECITTSQPLVDSMPASKKVTLGVSLKIVVGQNFNFIIQPLC